MHSIHRKLKLALPLLAGALLSSAEPTAHNLLIITTDDQGLQAGCYGDPYAITPNLDALAAEGTLFTRAYTAQASCSPARASLLTGLYPHQNGQIGLAGHHPEYRVKDGIPSLPSILKRSGFRLAILGKLHVSPASAFTFDFAWAKNDPLATRDVAQLAKKAEEFLDDLHDEERFFLYVNYFDPHRPFDAGSNQTKGLPEHPYTPDEVSPLPYLGIDGKPARTEAAAYYNSIRRMDSGLGMLFKSLKDRGLWEDTIIVFLGDHGPPFTRGKTTAYEAGEQIPLIIRWPGIAEEGQRTDALASIVDVLPTALSALDIKVSTEIAGQNLRPVLNGDTPEHWRNYVFGEYTSHAATHFFPRRAIRSQRYKLIHNLDSPRKNPVPYIGQTNRGAGNNVDPNFLAAYSTMEQPPEFEFYDIGNDPYETKNLIEDPTFKEHIIELQSALKDWRIQTNDPLLDPAELERLRMTHEK
ncbi:sulfatase family protein [Coraliomargarita sp. W4R53]